MKRFVKVVSLVLALVMVFAVTAFAEGEVPAGTTLQDENKKITIYGFDGATAVIEGDNDEFFKFTYTSTSLKAGNQYLLLVLPSKDGTAPAPTEENILYIDQVAAVQDGTSVSVTFETVYPINPADSVIAIYGIGADGTSKTLIAAVIKAAYLLGDVTHDGKVTLADVALIVKYLAGKTSLQ